MRGGFELVHHVAIFLERVRAGVYVPGGFAHLPKGIVLIERDHQTAYHSFRERAPEPGGRGAPGSFAPHVENRRAHAPVRGLLREDREHLLRNRAGHESPHCV